MKQKRGDGEILRPGAKTRVRGRHSTCVMPRPILGSCGAESCRSQSAIWFDCLTGRLPGWKSSSCYSSSLRAERVIPPTIRCDVVGHDGEVSREIQPVQDSGRKQNARFRTTGEARKRAGRAHRKMRPAEQRLLRRSRTCDSIRCVTGSSRLAGMTSTTSPSPSSCRHPRWGTRDPEPGSDARRGPGGDPEDDDARG